MLNLQNVTLITSICSNNYLDDTIKSFKYNCGQANFGASRLLFENIPYESYNWWLLKNLVDYVKTDFALIVQWDSGIINPHLWSEDFLQYDYIGAPWQQNWPNRVGNGGFSLRSKKYLETCSEIADSIPLNTFIAQNEDFFSCVSALEFMNLQKIKFAPFNVARKFSVERSCPEFYVDPEDISTYKSFGFHGDFNVAGMMKINNLI